MTRPPDPNRPDAWLRDAIREARREYARLDERRRFEAALLQRSGGRGRPGWNGQPPELFALHWRWALLDGQLAPDAPISHVARHFPPLGRTVGELSPSRLRRLVARHGRPV